MTASAASGCRRVEFPPFEPHRLLRSGRSQTLFSSFFPGARGRAGARQHEIMLADGDRVVLHDDGPDQWTPGLPAVLLLHGLAGCHQSSYMQRGVHKMTSRGWRVFRLDHRGSGAGSGLARRPYHAGRTGDALAAIAHVAELCPGSPLAIVGFSLSGNLVLKFAACDAERLPDALKTIVAICPPIDLLAAARNIGRPCNRRYDRHFTKLLWKMVPRYAAIAEELPEIATRRGYPASLYEFDDLVTAPMGGFAGVEDYYGRASSMGDLDRIGRPTLILAAENDHLIPIEMFRSAVYSPSTQLVTTAGGGHLGFIARRGRDPDRRWMDWRIIDWIAAQLR